MKRILLVDDDAEFVGVLKKVLEGEGYEVIVGTNGHQAIEALSRETFDLVLLDLIMPDKEGIETIREISRQWPDTQVIAMSGGGRIDPSEYLSLAVRLGAAFSIEKPFSAKELLAAVDRVLLEKSREGTRPE